MKIAFMMSEAVPFAKTGGLADVCGALPLELESLGHEVVMVMPSYQAVHSSNAILRPFSKDFDWATTGKDIRIYFLKHDMFMREALYGDRFGDYPDNLKRFSYFSSRSLELFQRLDFMPDIIHVHDWQTALVPLYVSAWGKKFFGSKSAPKTVLTIHNISYQGIFPREDLPQTGLGWEYFSLSGLEFFNKVNLLKGGIQYADIINTVSPTHAQEIQTKEYGCGLEGVLRNRRGRFFGVLNGIDYKIWNPQGDPHLFKHYSLENIADKARNKLKLQELCGLAQGENIPLCGFVGRLIEHKGIDLILDILPQLVAEGLQVIVLGKGEPRYEEALAAFAASHPHAVYFSSGFDDPLAHRIYAASDLFLMPSSFEPCGIAQLISYKYGTIPVAYRTGGLADTVEDYHQTNNTGTGFVFTDHDAAGLLLAVRRAKELLSDDVKRREFIERIMRLNFSWKESAKEYVNLYRKALAR